MYEHEYAAGRLKKKRLLLRRGTRDTLYKRDLEAGTAGDTIAHRALDLLPRGLGGCIPLVANRRISLGAVTASVVGGLLVQQEAGVPSPGEEWCRMHPALHLAKTSAQI